MQIIENQEKLSEFLKEFHLSDSIVIPIFSDHRAHPKINELYFIYVYLISLEKSYIIPFNTDDCINIDHLDIKKILMHISNKSTIKYVIDKKTFYHIYEEYLEEIDDKFIDIRVLEYISNGKIENNILETISTSAHNFIYYKFYKFGDLNKCISIYKHSEKLDLITEHILLILEKYKLNYTLESFKKINNLMIKVLYNLEKNGICVNENFIRKDLVKNNLTYGDYNLFTLTNRPVCNNNGYNFSSINKSDGSRKSIISRFGIKGELLLLDYNSYHLYLIADIIGEKFSENPHTHLAKIYLNKQEISEEEYEQCKEITFNIIYSKIPDEFKSIPFFKKIDQFTNELWKAFNSDKFVLTKYFKRKLYKEYLLDMNPQKLFNYYLQSIETENNMIILDKIFNFLNLHNFKSKIILYIYDAILIDFNIDDGEVFVNEIISILEQGGRFPISISHGKNYHDLIKI